MTEQLFERNLQALGGRFPELAERMRRLRPDASYRRVETASGLWNLVRSTAAGEESFYPSADPLEEARAYWQRRHLRNPAILGFLGLDLGYRLLVHLADPNPNTQLYLLVEKDPDVFYHFLHVVDVEALCRDPRVRFLVGVEEKDLFLALRRILDESVLFTLVKATAFESDSTSYRLATPYYRAVLVALRDAAVDLFAYMGNSPLDTVIGTRHMLLNLETIAREPGVDQLFGRFAGRPAVIVATGPSLDKNFRLLHEVQDRALLFSVDASLKFLLRNGIRPHFATCLERGPNTIPCFRDIAPEAAAETVQVAVPVVRPEVYGVYPGPKAILYRALAHFAWLRHEKGTLLTGHSSANMAFKLAEAMGCNPIILVGQDLAYAEDGSTHSSAPFWGKSLDWFRAGQTRTFRVKGNYADTVLTNDAWNLFRLSYVRDVASFDGTVINATEGGAHIEGTRVMTLREAIDGYAGEPFAPARLVREALRRPAEEEAQRFLAWVREERIPETVARLDETIRDFRAGAERARKTLAAQPSAERIGRVLQETYSLWVGRMEAGTTFFQAAFQVIQPTLVQVMIGYYDLPNQFHHVAEINASRLALLARCLDSMSAMLEKLRTMFLDPCDTTIVGDTMQAHALPYSSEENAVTSVPPAPAA